jgi:RHS repeat-associated protein
MKRLTKAAYNDGSYTEYTYDTAGRLTTITDSISGAISYTYSDSGCSTGTCGGGIADKVTKEVTALGTIDYAYDALGRRTSLTLPNGVTTNYSYDNASHLLEMKHLAPLGSVLEALNYGYDATGNRTSMNRQSVNLPLRNPVTDTAYDEANQMLRYNASSDLPVRQTGNIGYDENGNMTSMTNSCGTTSFTWDARNRLVGISGFKPDCSALSASFSYDALGRRTEKTINGATKQYLYDGLDIVQEIENSAVTANYIRTLNIDEPLARIKADGTVRYYQQDALGSVIALTDEAGAVKTQYSYDPFGSTTLSGEVSDNPFQYSGRENDGTGLYYYRARYYSPELQRFVSEDPIGFAGGINFYVYIHNQPINWVDPLGLFCVPIWSTTTGYQFDIDRTEWRLEGEKVIRDAVLGYCFWGKYEVGWMKRYITLYYLCCDDCSNCYIKTENTTDFNKYERRIAGDTTFMIFLPTKLPNVWMRICQR